MSGSVVEGVDLDTLNYTTFVPYNETIPTGGNSLIQDLNVHYEVPLTPPPHPSHPPTHLTTLGWRYRLDAHLHRARLTHDSRRRVCSRSIQPLPLYGEIDIDISFFYSGLARRKSALSLIWLSMMATAVTSFQWFFWGYSLTFSHTAGKFIGDLANIGFRNTLAAPSVGSHRIPDLMFAVYQGMFAAITYDDLFSSIE